MTRLVPSTRFANLLFLAVSFLILIGSSILAPILGLGTNLWINELLWILTPALISVIICKLTPKKVLKIKRASRRNICIGMLAAAGLWFATYDLSRNTGIWLNHTFGVIDTDSFTASLSVNQSILLLFGMLILAPICEELLFRGVIQSAYESYNGKHGYVYAAVLFGMFHIANGITEVIPTFLVGLLLGYLVHRTGSIITSMCAHMAFNFSSILFTGALGLNKLESVPIWLHLIALGGLTGAILLLGSIKVELQKAGEEGMTANAAEEGKTTNVDINPSIQTAAVGEAEEFIQIASASQTVKIVSVGYSLGSKITFALSGLYVICMGVLEIYIRAGA